MTTLPTHDQALHQALETARAALGPHGLLGLRRRSLSLCLGAQLAEPVTADRDLPPFDRVTMDGYAVRARDIRAGAVSLEVVGMAPAGAPSPAAPPEGACIAVSTGAPLPPGTDAVIPHEWTDRGTPRVLITSDGVEPWRNVHRQATDARCGQVLLEAGSVVDPIAVGIAAAVGKARPLIRGGTPCIRILSSGDEIRPASTLSSELLTHQIRDSNVHSLAALAPFLGARIESVAHVPDDEAATIRAVQEGLEHADLLVTIGGVSVGARDHFPRAMEAAGVRWTIRGVNLQPGKPFSMGVLDSSSVSEDHWRPLVLALPGNPVSAMVTAHLFLWPVLRILNGLPPALPWTGSMLGEDANSNAHRECFRPAARSGRPLVVDPVAWGGSGDFVHMSRAGGLVRLPQSADPIPAGACVDFLPWAWTLS